MKTKQLLQTLLSSTLALFCTLPLYAQEKQSAPPTASGHRLLIGGCGLGYVSIMEKDGSISWSIDEKNEVSDAWLLDNGNILFAYKHGVKEVQPDLKTGKGGTTIWDRPTAKEGETHACQPLPNGNILIGESYEGVSYLIELDQKQQEVAKIELNGLGGKHSTFRQVRKTKAGTYLITQQQKNGHAIEFDKNGKEIRRFLGGRYTALRLDNGNTLIACGDEHRLVEVDTAGKTVWEVTQNDLPGASLGFVAGLTRLPNGNTLICNWGGHGGAKGGAILEISPDKKIVWQSPAHIKNRVSTALPLK